MRTVYLAAPFALRDRARSMRDVLKLKGIGCSSRWLDGESVLNDEWARIDLSDVNAADGLVLLNPDGWEEKGTGGRWVEFGYALSHAKPILLIGERSNIFCHLTHLHQIDELGDFVKAIQRLLERTEAP